VIEIRNYGWFLRPDWRLMVERRDKSKLARSMAWQVDALRVALEAAGTAPLPRITPVHCFVDGRGPRFRPPTSSWAGSTVPPRGHREGQEVGIQRFGRRTGVIVANQEVADDLASSGDLATSVPPSSTKPLNGAPISSSWVFLIAPGSAATST